ncbi:nitroreductase family protein [Palleronia caenipelagi]|uniref:Putative NAD(P)H nitroreductase n=1 Tax=Palleronia caenipelagi TaxID=2489174 RepID=A0A547Q8X1_9RHOB|nr:nitroreductase [Palleronia caenipelagi]TRD22822.1 nitroreductase [Palleronia caenipelagi]
MPTANQAALDFLLTRRSRPAKTLTAPYPDRAALEPILRAALRSPDHKKLEPWRLMVLEKPALERLSVLVERLGPETGQSAEDTDKDRDAYARSGLAVAVVLSPVEHPKVPVQEQVLSAGAVCLSLLNAALASGWGANWLTGWSSHDATFCGEGLGLRPDERLAGVIHLGSERAAPPERPRPDPEVKITWVSE